MDESLWLMLAQAESGGETAAPAGEGGAQTQTTTTQPAPGEEPTPSDTSRRGAGSETLIFLALMVVVFWFVMSRGPRKRQQQQQQMLNALKKNDRIRTIGGIIGTIVEIRGEEVVLKIDETNNTKMHITRSAVGKIITEEEEQKK